MHPEQLANPPSLPAPVRDGDHPAAPHRAQADDRDGVLAGCPCGVREISPNTNHNDGPPPHAYRLALGLADDTDRILGAGLGVKGYRALYRYALRRGRKALDGLLSAVADRAKGVSRGS